jgi:hypothetical protein
MIPEMEGEGGRGYTRNAPRIERRQDLPVVRVQNYFRVETHLSDRYAFADFFFSSAA